jgi:hypothetical protein
MPWALRAGAAPAEWQDLLLASLLQLAHALHQPIPEQQILAALHRVEDRARRSRISSLKVCAYATPMVGQCVHQPATLSAFAATPGRSWAPGPGAGGAPPVSMPRRRAARPARATLSLVALVRGQAELFLEAPPKRSSIS